MQQSRAKPMRLTALPQADKGKQTQEFHHL